MRSRLIRIAKHWDATIRPQDIHCAADVRRLIDRATSGQIAAFAESIQGLGEHVGFSDNYLKHVYEYPRTGWRRPERREAESKELMAPR